jgi:aspartyl-tRNA(Asn)/glutamyl-tRNA(Gln) amidotransferase subunit B
MANFFEDSLRATTNAKIVANWMMGDLLAYLNAGNLTLAELKVTGASLGAMIDLIDQGTISSKIAKTVFREMLATGKSAPTIVEEQGLVQITDEGALDQVIKTVLARNPKSVSDYVGGNHKAIGFLVGQVMKETKGKASPGLVNKLLQQQLQQ